MADRHRVDPADGRVRSVTVDGRNVALSRCGARLGAWENHGPHQGGPLGEGSIEKGWLRCPWHGYDPLTGQPPEGFGDAVTTYPVEERPEQLAGDYPVQQTSLVNPDWAAYAEGLALLCVEQDAELL